VNVLSSEFGAWHCVFGKSFVAANPYLFASASISCDNVLVAAAGRPVVAEASSGEEAAGGSTGPAGDCFTGSARISRSNLPPCVAREWSRNRGFEGIRKSDFRFLKILRVRDGGRHDA
jgi:hypothetical protein